LVDPSNPILKAETLQGIPTLAAYATTATASGLMYKRILDFIAGIAGFMLFLILYPIIALATKLDSPGPVVFSQTRVGQHNRLFKLYKFRSMYADAESRKSGLLDKSEISGPMFKMENDPRITRVGRFLRKTSLDELPQFINILKGEMSLVGTRPPTPDEVKQYEDWHRRRISIKPGLTGLWQVSGRSKITDFREVVKLDLKYLDNWRFIVDLVILWKTLWVVLARKGAK
ncbi:MAG: exopolysaccharide biosynthesis polyprenyl glycosylphosphotransferase, partial [Pseudomonadota bacterium]